MAETGNSDSVGEERLEHPPGALIDTIASSILRDRDDSGCASLSSCSDTRRSDEAVLAKDVTCLSVGAGAVGFRNMGACGRLRLWRG